jgi:hypothetical protein
LPQWYGNHGSSAKPLGGPPGREFAQCNQILIPRCEAETATKPLLSANISEWFAVFFARRLAKTEDFRG